MSYELVSGDLFESNCDAICNACNCEGIMGGGIALEFKKRFPLMNVDYIRACKRGDLYPGQMHYFKVREEPPQYVINFPTKNKVIYPSKLEFIQKGLPVLDQLCFDLKLKTVAIPALGSGLGGLAFSDVLPLIEKQFLHSYTHAFIFQPHEVPLKASDIDWDEVDKELDKWGAND